jgi:hypothetical protein
MDRHKSMVSETLITGRNNVMRRGKEKFNPQHAIQAQWSSSGRPMGLHIRNFDAKWEWVVNDTPRPLYPQLMR